MNKKIMQSLGFASEVAAVEKGLCPFCLKQVGAFRDNLSEKEYKISGLCQQCQDKIY
ncbi:MAG TPA: hypothetical protein VLH15_04250 [Dehalococcoidales bacterium]|nr:hypothetical protein [Dehalococcoidales bacterium]